MGRRPTIADVPVTAARPTRRTRPSRRTAGWTLGVVAVLALAPVIWVQGVGQAHVAADPAGVPPTEVALVLGAGLGPGGAPSPYLQRRLDAAADLYAAGQVSTILASGDGVLANHDEPGAMRAWLLDRGVPDDAIVLDREGVDTTASCARAHDLFGVERAVVVTQDYHVRRAVFSCRAAGIDADGIGVSAQSAKPVQALWWHVREAPASLKAAWDALLG